MDPVTARKWVLMSCLASKPLFGEHYLQRKMWRCQYRTLANDRRQCVLSITKSAWSCRSRHSCTNIRSRQLWTHGSGAPTSGYRQACPKPHLRYFWSSSAAVENQSRRWSRARKQTCQGKTGTWPSWRFGSRAEAVIDYLILSDEISAPRCPSRHSIRKGTAWLRRRSALFTALFYRFRWKRDLISCGSSITAETSAGELIAPTSRVSWLVWLPVNVFSNYPLPSGTPGSSHACSLASMPTHRQYPFGSCSAHQSTMPPDR